MSKSKIEWTDETWNPVTGCTKVSPGCKNCYAERQWPRLAAPGQPYEGRAFTDIKCHEERLDDPYHWRKPRRVFVNSMSDLFHEEVLDYFIDEVFETMIGQQHIFQILTKRPERMRDYLLAKQTWPRRIGSDARPLDNVWLGVSAEDQETAVERIPLLLQTPAAVRFVSLEPLLGAVELTDMVLPSPKCGEHHFNCLYCDVDVEDDEPYQGACIDWVIVGGESGPKARPMHPGWVRSIRDECVATDTPFFFKQWGEWVSCSERDGPGRHYTFPDGATVRRTGKRIAGRTLDGREWGEYPE